MDDLAAEAEANLREVEEDVTEEDVAEEEVVPEPEEEELTPLTEARFHFAELTENPLFEQVALASKLLMEEFGLVDEPREAIVGEFVAATLYVPKSVAATKSATTTVNTTSSSENDDEAFEHFANVTEKHLKCGRGPTFVALTKDDVARTSRRACHAVRCPSCGADLVAALRAASRVTVKNETASGSWSGLRFAGTVINSAFRRSLERWQVGGLPEFTVADFDLDVPFGDFRLEVVPQFAEVLSDVVIAVDVDEPTTGRRMYLTMGVAPEKVEVLVMWDAPAGEPEGALARHLHGGVSVHEKFHEVAERMAEAINLAAWVNSESKAKVMILGGSRRLLAEVARLRDLLVGRKTTVSSRKKREDERKVQVRAKYGFPEPDVRGKPILTYRVPEMLAEVQRITGRSVVQVPGGFHLGKPEEGEMAGMLGLLVGGGGSLAEAVHAQVSPLTATLDRMRNDGFFQVERKAPVAVDVAELDRLLDVELDEEVVHPRFGRGFTELSLAAK